MTSVADSWILMIGNSSQLILTLHLPEFSFIHNPVKVAALIWKTWLGLGNLTTNREATGLCTGQSVLTVFIGHPVGFTVWQHPLAFECSAVEKHKTCYRTDVWKGPALTLSAKAANTKSLSSPPFIFLFVRWMTLAESLPSIAALLLCKTGGPLDRSSWL